MNITQALLTKAHACKGNKMLLTKLLKGERSIKMTRTNLRKAARAGMDLIWFAQWMAFELETRKYRDDFVIRHLRIGQRLDRIKAIHDAVGYVRHAHYTERTRVGLSALVDLLMEYSKEYDRLFPPKKVTQ